MGEEEKPNIYIYMYVHLMGSIHLLDGCLSSSSKYARNVRGKLLRSVV